MGLSCQTSGTENTEKKKKIKQFLFHCNMMKNLLNLSWDGVGGWWNCQTLSGLERIDAVNIKFQLHPLPSSTGAGARLSPAHPASPQFSTWEVSVSGDRGRKHWSLKYVMHPYYSLLVHSSNDKYVIYLTSSTFPSTHSVPKVELEWSCELC